jgi:hypothetical protein
LEREARVLAGPARRDQQDFVTGFGEVTSQPDDYLLHSSGFAEVIGADQPDPHQSAS